MTTNSKGEHNRTEQTASRVEVIAKAATAVIKCLNALLDLLN